jgi:phosphoribosylformylglycinamidine cyclo-ligase
MDYQQAGVDILAGRAFVERIRQGVESTYRTGVLGQLGGFGGCFELPQGYQQPVLVSGTDGVGTKLKIAQAVNRHVWGFHARDGAAVFGNVDGQFPQEPAASSRSD